MPFEVPEGWVWCRLDDLAFYKKGPFGSSLTKSMFIPDNGKAYKVYEQKNAIQKNASLGHYFISGEKFQELKGFEVLPNDIIVSCAGTIGETYIMPSDIRSGIINQALMIIRLYDIDITSFYLLYFDYILKNKAGKDGKGTAIKNIPPFDILKNYMIPLPPLREQIRIINEVIFWQNFIDSIDSNCDNISALCKRTKSKVLDLAISGKLLPQDNNDEPAINHLKKINPDYKTADNRHYANVPFDLPKTWQLTKLKDLCVFLSRGKSPKYSETDKTYPVFAQKCNLKDGGISLEHARFLDPTTVSKWKDVYKLKDGDILINSTGTGTVCRTRLFKTRYLNNYPFVVPDSHVSVIRLHKLISPEYAYIVLSSNASQSYMMDNLAGSTNQKELYISVLENLIFPVPPIEEQRRIVYIVKKISEYIDKIAAAL